MKDPWLPFTQAQQLASAIQKAEIMKMEEVGHYPQDHWSDKVSDAIQGFLRRQAIG
jgi:pimeloyl-ACP methyl ester carboxylesterase